MALKLAWGACRVGVWDKATRGARKVRRRYLVAFTRDGGWREGMLPWEFCCRAGDETWGLGLGEQRELRKSKGSLPCFLAEDCELLEGACWSWGLGYTKERGEEG